MLSPSALKVLESRYLLRNENGVLIETPEKLFRRVASKVAEAELKFGDTSQKVIWEAEFFRILTSLDFLPNTPTLMNAGTQLGQLSACFVLPVEDNLPAIFDTLKNAALIQQSGGGTGFNFSRLRPEGSYITKTGGTASGPVSFMQVFDATTEHVKQGGKRRGANMGILNVDHPDILKFINIKKEQGVLQNFNISVGISDAFMNGVERNAGWDLINPVNGKIVSTVNSRAIWNEIIKSAWESGDPGLIFLDEINRKNPVPGIGKIEATNPCGEVPLQPFEACNLGSVNLCNMVKEKGGKSVTDWDKLSETVRLGIRFLDNVVEINNYLLPEIENIARGNRKTGLGVMGWAEMLIKLGIPYDSDQAVEFGSAIMKFINEKSFEYSCKLAESRGVFPNWEKSIYYPHTKIRNATRTSIAPTGTISIIADTSSSIEPLFALAFERKHVLNGETMKEINHLLVEKIGSEKISALSNLNDASLIKMVPENIRGLFHTALNISWENHLKHQAAFQQYTDNAVSKTINMPESATTEDVERAYKMAWQMKAKGITIYRYNSKHAQVLNVPSEESEFPALLHDGTASCKVCVG